MSFEPPYIQFYLLDLLKNLIGQLTKTVSIDRFYETNGELIFLKLHCIK